MLALMAIFIRPRLSWIPAALPFLRLGETIFPKRRAVERLSGLKAGLLRGWQTRLASPTVSDRKRRGTSATPAAAAQPRRRASLPAAAAPRPRCARETAPLYALRSANGLGLSAAAIRPPVNEIPGVPHRHRAEQFPVAQPVAASLLTIPTHHLRLGARQDRDRRLCRDFRTVP